MDFSIIIVSYNTKDFLRKCLFSVSQQLIDLSKVIVVDNYSADRTSAMIKKDFPLVRLIINKKNVGFAAACNQGAKIAQAEILFFLNPDTLIQENIFPKIIKAFARDSKVGIVAPRLVLPDGLPQPWAYGEEQGLWRLVKNKFCPVSTQSPGNQSPSTQVPKYPAWVSGAALFIRRDVFKKVGGFDENFFMYFEDRDLCWRVRSAGCKIAVLLDTKVVHFGGRSLTANRSRKRLYYQSQNYYWRKHYGLFKALLMRLIRWPYKFFILNIQK
ncbi:glycosyltransferase family 2 protein [Patescibacteria group bacterium]|nr:glycosyltransferase family 2 protein [Patescibacteria group bacterium]